MTEASAQPRVLVVDDDESLRITLAANLELENLDVVEAKSAQEALALIREQHFDVVLSDVRMPGMNGVDMFIALRTVKPELPVILMTAFSNEETVRKAISRGVFAVIAKPFDVQQTVNTLQRALKHPLVVVVDDAKSVATSTAAALSSFGIKARAVFDGESALTIVRAGVTDVCVTDLAMPGMSGVDVVRRVRELDPSVSVIVFSGARNGDELMRRASAEGAAQCLRKPLDPQELVNNIANVRGGR